MLNFLPKIRVPFVFVAVGGFVVFLFQSVSLFLLRRLARIHVKQRTFKKVEVAGNHAVNTAILTVVLSLSLINFSPVLVFLIAQDRHQDYLRIHNYTAKPYICLAFKTKKSLLRRNWNQFQRTDETTEKKIWVNTAVSSVAPRRLRRLLRNVFSGKERGETPVLIG